MGTPQWNIIESRGRPGLVSLEADWRRLYAQTTERTSFISYEACLAHVDHFMPDPDQLRCLALTDGRDVRAICLLEPTDRTVLRRRQRAWGVLHQWHSRQANVLCPDDEARREVVPAVLAHLRHKPEGRQILILGPTPDSSTLWDGLRRLPRAAYFVDPQETVYALDCSMPFEQLRASIKSRFRQDLNRSQRRLSKLRDVRFVTTRPTDASSPELRTFFDLEASGWKGENGEHGAILCKEAKSAFMSDLAANLRGEDDYCEITALHAEGRCIAAAFGTRTGATYSGLKIGRDETYRQVSPGHLVVEKIVERCCQDPDIRSLDMVSDAAWVRGWCPDGVRLQLGYVVLSRWPAYPAVSAALQFRYGLGRRVARRLRGTRGAGGNGDSRP